MFDMFLFVTVGSVSDSNNEESTVTIDDSQQTTNTLSKACQGNTGYCCPLILSLFDYTIYVHGIALNLSLI